jgi:cytochrome oxidase Cu insertion factor (SCO1/SenC/PrrC family)
MLSSVLLLLLLLILLLFMFTFTQATWGGTEAAPAAPRTTAPAACTLTHDFGVSLLLSFLGSAYLLCCK